VAGGLELQNITVNLGMGVAYVSFDNPSWAGLTLATRGALIYNSTQSNKSIAVLDFGSDKLFTAANNTVTIPVNTASTALLRFV
jgi:hypothetical protein